MSDGRTIYLDNNATTALAPEVLDAMQPYLVGLAGNPSSRHAIGRSARRAIEQARRQIAEALNADPEEVLFTSGATEANCQAIFGAERVGNSKIWINPSEHPSCLEPVTMLATQGYQIEQLELNHIGVVTNLDSYHPTATDMVVVQFANSETGTIQPIESFVRTIPEEVHFHCDAVQAVGKFPIDFHGLGVKTLSLSGHKLHGPSGIGALLVRRRTKLRPTFYGGQQQQGIRPGTEPVASIVGLGCAVESAHRRLSEDGLKLARLRDLLETSLLSSISDVVCNRSFLRLPNTTNLSFLGASSEALVIALDLAGVCCSAGTACASGSMEPSTVLRAMGIKGERLQSAVRFSVNRFQTKEEIADAVGRIVAVVEQVRISLGSGSGKREKQ